jgi:CHAT domain-containing protein
MNKWKYGVLGLKRLCFKHCVFLKYLILPLFIVLMMPDVFAVEGSVPMIDRVYLTTRLEQREVKYSDMPIEQEKSLSSVNADITYVYPVGRPGFLAFDNAKWIVASDGVATVQLCLPRTWAPVEMITLSGIWETIHGITRMHLTGTGLYGMRIAFDGVLLSDDKPLSINGIFTVTVRGARHVEQVILRLEQSFDTVVDKWEAASIDGFRKNRELQQSMRQEYRLHSEPSEWIGGVPVPVNYDAKMRVSIDSSAEVALDGTLLISNEKGSGSKNLSILIATEGPVVNGWSGWDMMEAVTGTKQDKGMTVKASDGHIHVDISMVRSFRNMKWYIQNPARPDELLRVTADEGTMDIQINGDDFIGTIDAKGRVQDGDRPVSTFHAVLSGNRQGGDFIKKISAIVGGRAFGGVWRDARLGEMKIRQGSQLVKGQFSCGYNIEGRVSGAMLDLQWDSSEGKSGRGFLAESGNGILTGMIWKEGQSGAAEPVVATQSSPEPSSDHMNWFVVPKPVNDAQAMGLKLLGYDLDAAGKHDEAVKSLQEVVAYYAGQALKHENDPDAYSKYIHNQALPLLTLIDAASEAGNYPALVNALSMSVKVQRELGKDAVSLRSFRAQVEKYIDEIGKSASTMEMLTVAYNSKKENLSAVGIGISMDEGQNDNGILISGVLKGKPAARAGVISGDILQAVNGVSVAGMNMEQATQLIRGSAGSRVSLKVYRSGQTLNFRLLRTPMIALEKSRKASLGKLIAKLRALVAQAGAYNRTEAAFVKKMTGDLNRQSTRKEDVQTAFIELTARLKRLSNKLEIDRRSMIALAHRVLADSPEAMGLFNRFVAMENDLLTKRTLENDGMERMERLDRDEEAYEKRADVSFINKEMLRLSILSLGAIDVMRLDSRERLKHVLKAMEISSTASDSDQIAHHIASFSLRLDNWRRKMVTDAAKIESLQYGQDFYEKYVQALVDMNLPEQALVASEAGRARAFQDLLAAGNIGVVNESVIDSANVGFVNRGYAPALSGEDILDVVRQRKSTVVEYMMTESELFVWIINPKGRVHMIRQPLDRKALRESVDTFVKLVEPVSCTIEERKERAVRLNQTLRSLYTFLIEPIPERLLPADPVEPVTIVPFDELFRVPFNVLIDKNGKYFIDKHALVFSSAVSVLRNTHENKAKLQAADKLRLLAVVNPNPLPDAGFGQLDETEAGFQQLLKFYPETCEEDVLVGGNATKANLKSRLQAGGHSVVFFGTHGDINDTDVLQSCIMMAKQVGDSGQEDGKLRIADIFNLDLSSDLSILSACGTGRGSLSPDGVNGLSRAFFLGGSASLMTSLWSIPEMISIQQVYEFTEYWRAKGMSKANALRKTQLNSMRSYPEQPEIWASFQLYGEWE